MEYFFYILLSYLLGSIPFGLILTSVFANQDIRKTGSGNIGSTNVLRTGKKSLAFLTLILDAIKGVVIIYILEKYNAPFYVIIDSACFAVLGHMFPVWLKFKGGKGVATSLGIYLYFSPKIALFAIICWIITFFITKFSSLSSLIMNLVILIASFIYHKHLFYAYMFIVILVFVKHKENIIRMANGTEQSFKGNKKS